MILNTKYLKDDRPTNYLTITGSNGGQYSFRLGDKIKHWEGSLLYQIDDSGEWYEYDPQTILNFRNNIKLAGSGNTIISGSSYSFNNGPYFHIRSILIEGVFDLSGNLESLLDWKMVENNLNPSISDYAFYYLFGSPTTTDYNKIRYIEDLKLGTKILSNYCYAFLFYNCQNLLIDNNSDLLMSCEKLSNYCYSYMFAGCYGIRTAINLPNVDELAPYCFNFMFNRAKSMLFPPELPYMNLAEGCYSGMFNMSGLRELPALPATTLAKYCYNNMFSNIDSDITEEFNNLVLPAKQLEVGCYLAMFSGSNITSINKVILDTDVICADSCCMSMFNSTNITNINIDALKTLNIAKSCYRYMFQNCKNLTVINMILPATILKDSCYEYMFMGCSNIFRVYTGILPATDLSNSFGCYQCMFMGCTSLVLAPALPATTLAQACYSSMFQGCTSLKQAMDTLPATVSEPNCYQYMFMGCTNLIKTPSIKLSNSGALYSGYADASCLGMFQNCINLEVIPKLFIVNAMVGFSMGGCYVNMFKGCTKVKMSLTKTGEYQTIYKLPFSGEFISYSSGIFKDMFTNTGGTFTGDVNDIMDHTSGVATLYTSNELV